MSDRLYHVVECRYSGVGPWERIAAFNVDRAAETYASRCWEANKDKGGVAYRVKKHARVVRVWERAL